MLILCHITHIVDNGSQKSFSVIVAIGEMHRKNGLKHTKGKRMPNHAASAQAQNEPQL